MALLDAIRGGLQKWGYAQQQGQFGHTGSWGLPEFGLTELLTGTAYAAEPLPTYTPTPTPQPSPQPTPEPTGEVLGTQDEGTGGGGGGNEGGGGGEQQPPQPSPYETMYNKIISSLDALAGYLPQWRQEKEQQIENLYSSMTGEVEAAKKAELARFPGYREQVKQMEARNIKDLYQQMRNLLQAGAVRLGAMGAGDSSAVGAYGALLAKAGAKGVTDIRRQAMDLYNEISMKEQDVLNLFNQQMAQLRTWKSNEMSRVADWFNENRYRIETAKADVKQAFMNQLMDRLAQIDQQANAWELALREWAINNSNNIQEMKDKLAQLAQWQATPITTPRLQGITAGGAAPEDFWNPFVAKKREEEEAINRWLAKV